MMPGTSYQQKGGDLDGKVGVGLVRFACGGAAGGESAAGCRGSDSGGDWCALPAGIW